MGRKKGSFREAMEMVDDDLPDGAYWAMAHEMAGMEYGEGFEERTQLQESFEEEAGVDVDWEKLHTGAIETALEVLHDVLLGILMGKTTIEEVKEFLCIGDEPPKFVNGIIKWS